MRHSWLVWLVAVVVGSALVFPPVISAAEKMAPEKEKPKVMSATGDLVSVDSKAGMLAVKVKDKEMSFTAQTKAAKQALAKVKVGDRVTVSYTEKEGKMMASSIRAAKTKTAQKEMKK